MANGGWYGTKEEWERIEKPLLAADPIIDAFVSEFRLTVTKNHKDWPERSIEWGNGVRCLMQLYLVDKESLAFNLWLCASEDRGGERYWKQETPIKQTRIPDFIGELASQLRAGRNALVEWSNNRDQLTFATKLIQV